MTPRLVNSLIIFCVITLLICCREKRTIDRAFYYWKSQFHLDESGKRALEKLQVKKLYIKMFDVTWNGISNTSQPAAKTLFDRKDISWLQSGSVEIIPTIFITNETISKSTAEEIDLLSARISQLLHAMLADANIPHVQEVQIDCDWTASTRDKYFALLQRLKKEEATKGKQLSATIRLYQCKYRNKTGVPPVDKGLLMCYNMGNLKDPATANSIIESEELKKYTESLDSYPLALDIAFPLFDWKVLFRDGAYYGLVQDLPAGTLMNSSLFRTTENRHEVLTDTVLHGYVFKKGDVLRDEQSTVKEITNSAANVSSKLSNKQVTVSLYHLDSHTLSKYDHNELEAIYNSLH
jgi:hypothetical protein